jgi:NAD-dependent deacetylase sirtuin 2
MLEHMIGVPEEKIHNAHGSFKKGHCISCKKEYSLKWMKDEISAHEFLKCNNKDCSNGLVKPDIVFFGEALPDDFFNDLEEDFAKCDLLIIIGTSLKVHPFAGLTTLVEKECPRILVNRDPVGNDFLYDDPQRNYRDVFLSGECDEICLKISNLLKQENKLKEYQEALKVK